MRRKISGNCWMKIAHTLACEELVFLARATHKPSRLMIAGGKMMKLSFTGQTFIFKLFRFAPLVSLEKWRCAVIHSRPFSIRAIICFSFDFIRVVWFRPAPFTPEVGKSKDSSSAEQMIRRASIAYQPQEKSFPESDEEKYFSSAINSGKMMRKSWNEINRLN